MNRLSALCARMVVLGIGSGAVACAVDGDVHDTPIVPLTSNGGAGGNSQNEGDVSSSSAAGASGGHGGSTTGATGTGAGGESTPAFCAAGVVECDGTTKKMCDGHGNHTEVVDCAASGLVCSVGVGCTTCVAKSGNCAGQVGTYCEDDGSGYATETCDSVQGTSCDASSGRCTGACSNAALGTSYVGCDYYPTVTANPVVSELFDFGVAVSNTSAIPANITITRGASELVATTVEGGQSGQVKPESQDRGAQGTRGCPRVFRNPSDRLRRAAKPRPSETVL